MEGANFEDILARLFKAIGSGRLKDLAAALDISDQAVSKALKKKSIPRAWAYTLSTKTNHSLEWLLYGTEDAYTQEQTPPMGAPAACTRCAKLEKELEMERESNRKKDSVLLEWMQKVEARTEENGQLRLENMKLQMHLDTARQMNKEYHAKIEGLQEQLAHNTPTVTGVPGSAPSARTTGQINE